MGLEDRVKRIDDQDLLYKMAMSDQNEDVRYAATLKLDDEKLVKRLFKKSVELLIRITSAEKIVDKRWLRSIARDKNEDLTIRVIALEKLKSQKISIEIFSEGIKELQRECVKFIKDQQFLEKIMFYTADSITRKRAISNIHDPELLSDIIVKDESYIVKVEGIRHMADASQLNKLRMVADDNLQPLISGQIQKRKENKIKV